VASTLIGLSLCLLVLWEGGLFAGQTWAWHHMAWHHMAWVLVLQAITLLVVYALLRGARYSESIADWVDQVEWQNLQHLRAIQQRDDIEAVLKEISRFERQCREMLKSGQPVAAAARKKASG
jgi:hypothetical protein